MKFPNHLILDFNNNLINFYNNYWINKFNNFLNQKLSFFFFIFLKKKINKNIINTNNLFKYKFQNIINLNKFKIWIFFNINFLKKEKIYTKLKYSRVPQYDIVSGGVAALFSGFLGFLICEKFGLELLDSGDFYILFMYFVFISFFFKLFLKLINNNNFSWNFLNYKWFVNFYINLIFLFLIFKNYIKYKKIT